ncbi:S41 family peptidase [Ruania alba]|uniref:Tricorn protease homolog n=1 Tax=Ruania alba TaxID=648782 RepID=A0A1H5N813_9MICO|nr:S41 family peptidase [Ruania alba]SEE97600.1 tricorn protease [Ruania alba]
MTSGYLRDPHLHADLVTFVAADDVWLAPTDGGRAWRLTHDSAPVRRPRFSPDGLHVAFVSTRDGHPELMVADVETGQSRRLTWWAGTVTIVLGWRDAETILVASNAGEASIRHTVVKAVRIDGDTERLTIGAASGLALHPGGAIALSTFNARGPAMWKRYRGGTASRLWLFDDGSWQRLLPEEHAGMVDPLWVGDRLLFTSDRAAAFPDRTEAQANLWVWDALTADAADTAGAPRQLTHQGPEAGYVRDASTDGARLAWHSRGRLWLLESLDGEARRVQVTLPGTAPAAVSTPVTRLDALAVDHTGDHSVVTWRGKAAWLAHRDGPARTLVGDAAVRTREPVVLGRTGRVAVVTDAAGPDALEVHSTDGSAPPQRMLAGRLGRVLHLAADPAGARLAAISHDGWVRLITLADGGGQPLVRDVTRSAFGESLTPSFSPDGRYLVWSEPTDGESGCHRVMLLDTAGEAAPVALTSGQFHDRCPAITSDGKHVVFLSDRTFDPQYDAHAFALAFSGATRPWLIPLAAREAAPFGPSLTGRPIAPDSSSGSANAGADGEQPAPASPDVDAEGAEERITPFPVPSARYRDLRVVDGGVVWIAETDDAGVLGTRRAGVEGEPAADAIHRWSFAERTLTTIVDKATSYTVSGDGIQLVVLHSNGNETPTVTVTPATRKPEDEDPGVVTVDLSRLRVPMNPTAEWRQMFNETTRLMADHYWREDMNGVDWDAVVDRWRPVVDQVRSHDELVDLLWETVGELNTSHAYVIPAENGDRDRAARRLGLLGADLARTDSGWQITRILPGESSDPQARSPLRAAGVDAAVGDLVVAVDGQSVDVAAGPGPLLVGAADKPVELTLRRGTEDRRVVVVPLASEEVLRYQDWVRSRREYVRARSGGRLGYLHVPDMMSNGWAQLHRDLRVASRAEGIVADVRYNRGGHTSQLVVAKLAARVVGWGTARHEDEPMSYPDAAPRGPVVLVANEFSGSDGDIVNAAAQALELGPVVGVRTWGGVIGIDGRYDLVDGTSVTQPRYATWLAGKGWGVENYGVDPDIEVQHTPADLFAEDDPQLDRAIAEALGRLESNPAASGPPLPEPRVR